VPHTDGSIGREGTGEARLLMRSVNHPFRNSVCGNGPQRYIFIAYYIECKIARRKINILARSWENTDFDYDITSVAKVQFEHLFNAIRWDQGGPDRKTPLLHMRGVAVGIRSWPEPWRCHECER
jgi:hypothetical protein